MLSKKLKGSISKTNEALSTKSTILTFASILNPPFRLTPLSVGSPKPGEYAPKKKSVEATCEADSMTAAGSPNWSASHRPKFSEESVASKPAIG